MNLGSFTKIDRSHLADVGMKSDASRCVKRHYMNFTYKLKYSKVANVLDPIVNFGWSATLNDISGLSSDSHVEVVALCFAAEGVDKGAKRDS